MSGYISKDIGIGNGKHMPKDGNYVMLLAPIAGYIPLRIFKSAGGINLANYVTTKLWNKSTGKYSMTRNMPLDDEQKSEYGLPNHSYPVSLLKISEIEKLMHQSIMIKHLDKRISVARCNEVLKVIELYNKFITNKTIAKMQDVIEYVKSNIEGK